MDEGMAGQIAQQGGMTGDNIQHKFKSSEEDN
jgi:hypothetical protein